MWMEEHIGKQVNVERSQELLATGASRIATACPFCYIMIDDGVKGQGVEDDEVKVADIAMHLLEALENAERASVLRCRNGRRLTRHRRPARARPGPGRRRRPRRRAPAGQAVPARPATRWPRSPTTTSR